jgi:hypothetical protein
MVITKQRWCMDTKTFLDELLQAGKELATRGSDLAGRSLDIAGA